MLNIHYLMESLSTQRPVFHSEADFQHALAWHIHEKMPDSQIRLEYPVRSPGQKPKYLDIWLPKEQVAIELKYFSTKLEFTLAGEPFELKEHAATDLARQYFVLDVQRLEGLIQDKDCLARAGFAVMLTNCPLLWTANRGWEKRNDVNFRVHEGRRLGGDLVWLQNGQPYEGLESICLSGTYELNWYDYSSIPKEQRGHFRYLAVSIEP